jgi:dUTP pyrophosphatase
MATLKIYNKSKNALPAYASEYSAGMDLRADLAAPVLLNPMERKLIPTGLFIELPQDCEAQIRPRSGLALKHGVTVLNSPGTIDADYRGEVQVLLVNLSQEPFEIIPGERIAQMVIAKYQQVALQEVASLDELSSTGRGTGGFGHSGRN